MLRAQSAWIVVAEDNASDIFLIRQALNGAGLWYRMDAVSDGDAAFRLIDHLEQDAKRPFPDLFVIDLNLPRRSGEEILARVRSSPRGAGSLVIIMSSSDAPDDRDRARRLGANLYFRKPLDLDEFMKIGGHVQTLLAESNHDDRPARAGDPRPDCPRTGRGSEGL